MTQPRVLVYGDLMLDIYVTGAVKRDSPEAPGVSVLSVGGISEAPGGAANVAANVASLGGAALVVGVVGDDPVAETLQSALVDLNVSVKLFAHCDGRTTCKTRFLTDSRHLLRVDIEKAEPLAKSEEKQIYREFSELAKHAQAIVISDYGKGAVTPQLAKRIIQFAVQRGIPVVVDAKQPAATCYHGATVIKPNLKEIAAALGMTEPPPTDKDVVRAATLLWSKSKGTKYVVLTRGDKGMCLVGDEGALKIEPHIVKEVDVTGAGDTVAAALALALARGEDIMEATHFANAAAAVAVTKSGTARPTPEEVLFFYGRDSGGDRALRPSVAAQGPANRLH